jgi:hypothetical protein
MSFTFVPNPSQMSGSARRMSYGLKKILKNGFSSTRALAYLTGGDGQAYCRPRDRIGSGPRGRRVPAPT